MNKVAEKIQNLIDKNKVKKSCSDEYTLILQELDKYKDNLDEIVKIQGRYGHTHFLTTETEEKVLKLIEKDDRVLTIQDKNSKKNIGMMAASLKLENIVLRALDNETASTQQNLFGDNIGMISARFSLEKCVLKALDNKEASTQKANGSEVNIGMLSAIHCLEKAVIKALDNEEASIQQDIDGSTIGMKVAREGMEELTLKAIENKRTLLLQDSHKRNMAMHCLYGGVFDCASMIVDEEPLVTTQQDEDGYNLAMWGLSYDAKDLVLKAMNDPMVLIQRTFYDHTLKDMLLERPELSCYDEVMAKIEEMEQTPEYITAFNLANQDDEIIDLNQYVYNLEIVGENENENI